MNFTEYQMLCLRTANFWGTPAEIISNMCMGLAGETGETVDYVKKVLFHSHDFDKEKLESELGDILWYLTALANVFNINLKDIAKSNIEKLKERYSNGFEYEKSINRG